MLLLLRNLRILQNQDDGNRTLIRFLSFDLVSQIKNNEPKARLKAHCLGTESLKAGSGVRLVKAYRAQG